LVSGPVSDFRSVSNHRQATEQGLARSRTHTSCFHPHIRAQKYARTRTHKGAFPKKTPNSASSQEAVSVQENCHTGRHKNGGGNQIYTPADFTPTVEDSPNAALTYAYGSNEYF
jgi:hypothetical protein